MSESGSDTGTETRFCKNPNCPEVNPQPEDLFQRIGGGRRVGFCRTCMRARMKSGHKKSRSVKKPVVGVATAAEKKPVVGVATAAEKKPVVGVATAAEKHGKTGVVKLGDGVGVVVSFERHPELYADFLKLADAIFRTPEAQILSLINDAVRIRGGGSHV